MEDSAERLHFLRLAQAQRPRTRESWIAALVFAAQAAGCAAVLLYGYSLAKVAGGPWAVVSAILVLQPGLDQSLRASAARIAANLVGALNGALIGSLLGAGPLSLILALTIVILLCEWWRLDLGARSACASVIIVMSIRDASVVSTSLERMAAVGIGCGVALLAQIFTNWIVRQLRRPVPIHPVAEINRAEEG